MELGRYIELLEKELGKSAKKNFLPMQLGDVPNTSADVSSLAADIGYSPNTPVEEGIRKFAIWRFLFADLILSFFVYPRSEVRNFLISEYHLIQIYSL